MVAFVCVCMFAVEPFVLMSYMFTGLSLYQSDTILTVGQKDVRPAAPLCNSADPTEIAAGVKVACPRPSLLPKNVSATWPPKA